MNAFRRCAVLGIFAFVIGLSTFSAHSAEPGVASSLQPFVDSHTLAGAVVLVANNDTVLSVETIGHADIGGQKPMQKDNMFWIASMSKPLTGTAVMLLVDDGKIKLDDPVEKYLPEYKGQWTAVEQDAEHILLKKSKTPLLVKHLLSHTGGLISQSPLESRLDMFPIRENVITYALSPLKFEPGSKYEYNNPGINTLGRIIEVVSGMPFEEFMQKRLFDPLGMKDTTFWPNEEQTARLAKAYKPNAAKDGLEETQITYLTYPVGDKKRGAFPGGGYFSTATDMAIFCRMVLNGGTHDGKRLVSEASVHQMTATQTGDLAGKDGAGYGYGWQTTTKLQDGSPLIAGPCGHGGAYATNMWINPQKKLVTIFMVQHAGFPGTEGGKIMPTFRKAAEDKYGSAAK